MRRYLSKLVKASVVAHTRDGRSVAGVLLGVYRDTLVLGHAAYLLDDGRREPLEGDLAIPRDNLAFLQVER